MSIYHVKRPVRYRTPVCSKVYTVQLCSNTIAAFDLLHNRWAHNVGHTTFSSHPCRWLGLPQVMCLASLIVTDRRRESLMWALFFAVGLNLAHHFVLLFWLLSSHVAVWSLILRVLLKELQFYYLETFYWLSFFSFFLYKFQTKDIFGVEDLN